MMYTGVPVSRWGLGGRTATADRDGVRVEPGEEAGGLGADLVLLGELVGAEERLHGGAAGQAGRPQVRPGPAAGGDVKSWRIHNRQPESGRLFVKLGKPSRSRHWIISSFLRPTVEV
jgi:hypothetical protein